MCIVQELGTRKQVWTRMTLYLLQLPREVASCFPQHVIVKAALTCMDSAWKQCTKEALGMPIHSSTQRQLDMGAHNVVEKLIEAHLSNQSPARSHGARTNEPTYAR